MPRPRRLRVCGGVCAWTDALRAPYLADVAGEQNPHELVLPLQLAGDERERRCRVGAVPLLSATKNKTRETSSQVSLDRFTENTGHRLSSAEVENDLRPYTHYPHVKGINLLYQITEIMTRTTN